ncbi:MAG: primosomal protein N' [Crocinitomicaceae bacterium]|nr:MAG: primosomal protein N' [Crocinitomicaceae bacterium]
MSERKTLFADIIIPIPVKNEFTYRVPFEMNELIKAGMRVVVPFGKGKLYTGIVSSVHEQIPKDYQAKFIEYLLDEYPIITGKQYQFWKWIASYYMAPIGDVMNAALPANFKLASETKITLHPEFELNASVQNERFLQILDALEVQETLDLKEISEIVGIKTIQPIIKQMIDLRMVISLEELSYKYVPKTAIFYFFEETYQQESALNELLESFEQQKNKEKQVQALLTMLQVGDFKNGYSSPVLRKSLEEKDVSLSALQTLEKNGILRSERLQIDRIGAQDSALQNKKTLSESQQTALQEIQNSFQSNPVCLLHGVTGSGKTEIYVELIEEQLHLGKQVLFLLPEIALTTQLIQRLSAYFGDKIGVYHSKFNQNERVEIWNHVLHNHPDRYRIVLGARSSLFLPFQNLGLVIVDEEHESSFKQYDPSPRYNARDASIVLANSFQAKVLLGSATPAIETYYHAKNGKYGLVELKERHGGLALPEIFCADIKKERKEKTMHSHISSFLLKYMESALEKNEQIILFQNRRGYTPIWTCEICNWSPKCKSCDVSLTYHKHTNSLKCHYCGYSSAPIGTCGNCGSNRLKMLGFGTEKIEDELSIMFPNKTVARLDLDTTRSKNAYQNIISDFENRKIDILVGTQMVTKGLDFDHVSLVGILDADMLLNRPDFRAFERSYQLMSQVAGRAGRKSKRGTVVIQTGQPEHWIIQKVMQHDYETFYENEIIERRNFFYPPFYKLIYFTLKHKEIQILDTAANAFSLDLRDVFKERVLGPEYPAINRINNLYIKQVVLKVEREASNAKVKNKIDELVDKFYSSPIHKSVRLTIDVDPS